MKLYEVDDDLNRLSMANFKKIFFAENIDFEKYEKMNQPVLSDDEFS